MERSDSALNQISHWTRPQLDLLAGLLGHDLTLLTTDRFAFVTNPLAFVRLRFSQGPNFGGELAVLQGFAKDGLVRIDGATITVTEPGRPWLRVICAVFDGYLQKGRARHSAAV